MCIKFCCAHPIIHMHKFPIINSRTALETIEKLSHTLDFSDYASQIIHAIIQVYTHMHCILTVEPLYSGHPWDSLMCPN